MKRISMSQLVEALAKLGINIEEVLGEIEREAEIPVGPGGNVDYVEFGSEEHANLLGLERVVNGKDVPEGTAVVEDAEGRKWKLIDPAYSSMFSMPQFSIEQIERTHSMVLSQRVNELNSEPPKTQSKDPRKPHFAPTMWQPNGTPFAKQTSED